MPNNTSSQDSKDATMINYGYFAETITQYNTCSLYGNNSTDSNKFCRPYKSEGILPEEEYVRLSEALRGVGQRCCRPLYGRQNSISITVII